MSGPTSFEVLGTPPPWTVTTVDKFIVSALGRVAKEGGTLPPGFRLSLCPWGERNAIGGTPFELRAVSDPRFRIVHFTGCSRPYLVAVFLGEGAGTQQQVAMRHLPWSEHYEVELLDGHARLRFLADTEDPGEAAAAPAGPRTLMDLFQAGQLAQL